MYCKQCGEKAVINMRHHHLALCRQHYLAWVPAQVQHAIEKYHMFTPDDRLLVAVSGGKDSLSLWDILHKLGYQVDGLYIGLGIDKGVSYSQRSHRLSADFASQRGLHLHIVDIPADYGASIPEIASRTLRGRIKPCAVCGMSKRHIMNRFARQGGFTILATGHNLDDEASVLLSNTLNWIGRHLVRQAPVLEADAAIGLVRKVKPLCRMYEREMAAYALLSGIEYIYEECPFAADSTSIYYKEMLNRLEADRPGAKLSFYLGFLASKEAGLFASQPDHEKVELRSCYTCGQPTSLPGECAFCQSISRLPEA